jgi:hypothetical protein
VGVVYDGLKIYMGDTREIISLYPIKEGTIRAKAHK